MAAESAPARKMRILAIDDTPDTLNLVSEVLGAQGFEVHGCTDGAAGLEAYARLRPDLVLLDLRMPRMSGFELCDRIRKMTARAVVPIIVLTAMSGEEEKVKAIELGADDFLTKPFYHSELIARVKAHLRTKRLHDELLASNRRLKILQLMKERTDRLIAHDLTDHLNSILGYVQLTILDRDRLPEKAIGHLEKISRSAEELLKTIARLSEQAKEDLRE